MAIPDGIIRINRYRAEPSGLYGTTKFLITVRIDDITAGLLRASQQFVAPVPSGPHRVELRWVTPLFSSLGKSEVLHVLVGPGEDINLDCEIHNGPMVRRLLLHHLGDLSTPAPSVSGAADARVLAVTQMKRIEEQLGEDVRLIDNRASPAPVTRSLKASREWTRTLTLGESRSRTLGGNVSANLLWLSAKGSIEAELQHSLSLAIGSTHLFEEEFGVTVPARTALRIVLDWKRIWQCGEARVLLPDRSVHTVPYQVVVSVTFDQKIQDVTSFPDG
ncbi:hypothetical protein GCM10009760_52870 [Kitasatospora kazusensis]|uniref:Uncharacterized protein n=1 Tax=Kitasatospora kazusensis TaxID=407974 RepID=A0ABP5LYM6_9ACTN